MLGFQRLRNTRTGNLLRWPIQRASCGSIGWPEHCFGFGRWCCTHLRFENGRPCFVLGKVKFEFVFSTQLFCLCFGFCVDRCHSNGFGQIGSNDAFNTMILAPKVVFGGHIFTSITAGAIHTCASSSTAVLCWGGNTNGQLGSGTLTQFEPTLSAMCFLLLTDFASDRALLSKCWLQHQQQP